MKKIELRKMQNMMLRLVVVLGLIISVIGFQNSIVSNGSSNTATQLADSGATGSQRASITFKKDATGSQM